MKTKINRNSNRFIERIIYRIITWLLAVCLTLTLFLSYSLIADGMENTITPDSFTDLTGDEFEQTSYNGFIIFNIEPNEFEGTEIFLPEGVPVTEAELLAGVSAVDENGGPVTVTVADTGGLDLDNPEPTEDFSPYIIIYEAVHSVSGEIFTAAREAYVTINFVPANLSVQYLDAGGVTRTQNNVIAYTGQTELGEAAQMRWYVVTGPQTPASRITVTGDVHIILANGSHLNANNSGIQVQNENRLTIYAQSTEETTMGRLTAGTGSDVGQNSAIGGNASRAGGFITINGGMVTASGRGAGIGGGRSYGNGGTIIINGGIVTANGSGGAGIGAGELGEGGNIIITGGTVTATGNNGAGIGGARLGAGGNILIFGENTIVRANGGTNAQDIGEGAGGTAGNVFVMLPHGQLRGRSNAIIGNEVRFIAEPAASGTVQALLPAPFNENPFGNGTINLFTASNLAERSMSVITTFTSNITFRLNTFNVQRTGTVLSQPGASVVFSSVPQAIRLSPSGNHDFGGSAVFGYANPPAALSVTVTSTGTNATGQLTAALSGTNAGSFVITGSPITGIPSGGTAAFTVQPAAGLAAGAHTATVTVSGGSVSPRTFTVSFTVAPAPITSAAITVTAPVVGIAPNISATGSGNFSIGNVTWTPNDNPFLKNRAYTAQVTLTANANYTFAGISNVTINSTAATIVETPGNTLTISRQFPNTGALTLNNTNFTVSNNSHTFNGLGQGATVSFTGANVNTTTAGTITANYEGAGSTSYGRSTTAPTNVGTYNVLVTTAGGTLYDAVTTHINVGTLTISPLSVSEGIVGAFAAMTYTGSPQTPSAAVTVNSLTATGSWSNVTNVTDTTTFTASGNFTGTIANQTTNMARAAGNFVTPGTQSTTYTPTLTLGNVSLPIDYVWDAPGTELTVADNGQQFSATFTDPSGNFHPAGGLITVDVAKAPAPVISFPASAGVITFGQTLANSEFYITGDVTSAIFGTFAWTNPTTAPTVAQSGTPFEVTFTPSAYTLENYETIATRTSTVAVTVTRAAGNFGTPGTQSTTYTPTLTLGNVSLPIDYVWDAPGTELTVADNGQQFSATFTDPSGNFHPVGGYITVNVAKAPAPVISFPASAGVITFGQTLANSEFYITGDVTSAIFGTFAWTNPTTAPTVAQSDNPFEVTFTPSAYTLANYETITTLTSTVAVTVNKAAAPVVDFPTSASDITFGQTLADSELDITGDVTSATFGTFAWTNPTTAPIVAQSGTPFEVTFTPSAYTLENYETIETLTSTVAVTVNKATAPVINFPTSASDITFGQTLADSELDITGNVTSATFGTFAWTNPTTAPTVAQSGNLFEVTFTPSAYTLANYETIETLTSTVAVTVNNALQDAPINLSKIDETAAGANNGAITGVTTAMEYRLQNSTTYNAVTGTEITNLAPGTYLVRYAAKPNFDASLDTVITILAYVPTVYSPEPTVRPNPTPTPTPQPTSPPTDDDSGETPTPLTDDDNGATTPPPPDDADGDGDTNGDGDADGTGTDTPSAPNGEPINAENIFTPNDVADNMPNIPAGDYFFIKTREGSLTWDEALLDGFYAQKDEGYVFIAQPGVSGEVVIIYIDDQGNKVPLALMIFDADEHPADGAINRARLTWWAAALIALTVLTAGGAIAVIVARKKKR